MSVKPETGRIGRIQTILGELVVDNRWGPKSQGRLEQVAAEEREKERGTVLRGDGTWPFTARVDGADVVVDDARITCFGGSNDPQDSGETASGISTRKNPDLAACSLPMDGRMFSGLSKGERAALNGSPIPRVPWKTIVRVTVAGKNLDVPVIDLGPHKRTGNALDLTIAAARHFNPKASATNFKARGSFRIFGAAKYVQA